MPGSKMSALFDQGGGASAGSSGTSGFSNPTAAKGGLGISGAMGAGGDILEGIDAAKIGSRISGQYTRLAQQINLEANAKINSEDTQANQLMGTARTVAASGGVTQGGSTQVVNNASFTEQTLKDAYTRYSAGIASSNALYAAANARWEGKIKQQSSFVKAGTSLLTTGLMMAAI